jgi:hypothetical protein
MTAREGGSVVHRLDNRIREQARFFGLGDRHGGWLFAVCVARCVKPRQGQARGSSGISAGGKVSARRFAEMAGRSPTTVMAYLDAWNAAADRELVPLADTLTPASDPPLPPAGLWHEFYPPGQPAPPPPPEDDAEEYAMAHPDENEEESRAAHPESAAPPEDQRQDDPAAFQERVRRHEEWVAREQAAWDAQVREEAIEAPVLGANALIAWMREHPDRDDDTCTEISAVVEQALGLLAQIQQMNGEETNE